MSQSLKILLVLVAILIGTIVALAAAGLSRAAGHDVPTALTRGSVAFAGAVTLVLLVEQALQL